MKKLIFSGTGYPVSIKTLEFLQDNTLNAVSAFAKSKVNYEVVWGMNLNLTKTQLSDGAFVFNGEIIPFVGGLIGINSTLTIDEIIDNESFNTNPNSVTAVESLPAYSVKTARIGTGGLHSFPIAALKRYKQQIVIDSGVTTNTAVNAYDGENHGVVHCAHIKLTEEELANSMVIYTLTRAHQNTSYMVGAKHNLLHRSSDHFLINITMPLNGNEMPMVYWQIVRLK
ncbi:hypothetical protein [Myroides odoratus]|uniref:Uncharacterized protein n=1 Tax=Myroides odoratus TaxID=256 RepID=A0A9Q6Z9J8_MYROD|nr:hypothetical protein [Myroides odoratus]EHQ43474.1 hypothetical protein Myrod_2653 [Myroides odoratus DSM 2801]EKB06141.1 hypothetical protein HMPREF9716_02517 [Myroides odoratus CIP 103059]QQU00808.1 hypothetical protein I6I88_03305 [Myroides odoratus]WQD56950.1 hypothetical protein U0010_15720 [Myroides odoratus]STZ30753.1 Uncharacterised protein [Myroides odoratus]